jgi:hypothetical protein
MEVVVDEESSKSSDDIGLAVIPACAILGNIRARE